MTTVFGTYGQTMHQQQAGVRGAQVAQHPPALILITGIPTATGVMKRQES